MITIKDIAREAGLSHGTVSNVLNKKGNVSAEKIILVEGVAKRMGYKINKKASQLRAQSSKHVILILPNTTAREYHDFYSGVMSGVKTTSFELVLLFTHGIEEEELLAIEKAESYQPHAILLITSCNKIHTSHRTENLYLFQKKLGDIPCFTFDFYQAGRDIAQSLNVPNLVAISCPVHKNPIYQEFYQGILSVLHRASIPYVLFSESEEQELHAAFAVATDDEEFDAIICSQSKVANYIPNLLKFHHSNKIPEIYTLASRDIIANNIQHRYELNYQHAGEEMLRQILGKNPPKEDVIFPSSGFPSQVKPAFVSGEQQLTFLILTSPTATILKKMLPDFTKKTGIAVKLISMPYEELFQVAKEDLSTGVYDIVRLDVVWLKQLAQNSLLDLSQHSKDLERVLDQSPSCIPEDYFSVNGSMLSIPFDVSVQMLFYRKDLFENSLHQREFYEKYKKQLIPPENYQDFHDISQFFTRKFNPQSPTKYGTTQVFGLPMSAASDYLPRLFGEGGVIFTKDSIHVKKDVFLRTLSEYKKTGDFTEKTNHLWWNTALEQLTTGKIAMCSVYSNHISQFAKKLNTQGKFSIDACKLPLNSPLLGGGVLGISKNSAKKDLVFRFLQWLYSDEIANISVYMGGFIANKNILNHAQIQAFQPWTKDLAESFTMGSRRNEEKTIAKFDEYTFETEVGKAVRFVCQDLMTPEESYKIIENYIQNANGSL